MVAGPGVAYSHIPFAGVGRVRRYAFLSLLRIRGCGVLRVRPSLDGGEVADGIAVSAVGAGGGRHRQFAGRGSSRHCLGVARSPVSQRGLLGGDGSQGWSARDVAARDGGDRASITDDEASGRHGRAYRGGFPGPSGRGRHRRRHAGIAHHKTLAGPRAWPRTSGPDRVGRARHAGRCACPGRGVLLPGCPLPAGPEGRYGGWGGAVAGHRASDDQLHPVSTRPSPRAAGSLPLGVRPGH